MLGFWFFTVCMYTYACVSVRACACACVWDWAFFLFRSFVRSFTHSHTLGGFLCFVSISRFTCISIICIYQWSDTQAKHLIDGIKVLRCNKIALIKCEQFTWFQIELYGKAYIHNVLLLNYDNDIVYETIWSTETERFYFWVCTKWKPYRHRHAETHIHTDKIQFPSKIMNKHQPRMYVIVL